MALTLMVGCQKGHPLQPVKCIASASPANSKYLSETFVRLSVRPGEC